MTTFKLFATFLKRLLSENLLRSDIGIKIGDFYSQCIGYLYIGKSPYRCTASVLPIETHRTVLASVTGFYLGTLTNKHNTNSIG